jgi:hypothetical protein
MKKLSRFFVCGLLISISALAYGKSKPLGDKQMDQISAGSAIADGESNASSSRSFSVNLDGSALNGASAINIVNAANSTVADGVNTWSGGTQDNSGNDMSSKPGNDSNGGRSAAAVLQLNAIAQRGVPCDCGTPGAVVAATASRDEIEADAATANAIALDGSTATDTMSESVNLSGSAESDAHAINIVNAAGSLVANGVNVASSANINDLRLAQVNVIVQNAH